MQFSPGQDKGGTNRNVAPGKGCSKKNVREVSMNKAKESFRAEWQDIIIGKKGPAFSSETRDTL